MNRAPHLLLAILALAAFPSWAQQDEDIETDLEITARQIRSGEIPVAGPLSMDYRKGRFHTIHIDLLGLDCGTCHWGERYQDDYLLVRKDEVLRKRAKGQADRQVCVACHQRGGIATTFYMRRAGEQLEPAVKQ
jgi:hypothetical protein